MPTVIGYAYNAGVHCPDCVKAAHAPAAEGRETDEHGIPYALQDGEGNAIHPIYSTDETPPEGLRCDTCGAEIVEPDPERAFSAALEEDADAEEN